MTRAIQTTAKVPRACWSKARYSNCMMRRLDDGSASGSAPPVLSQQSAIDAIEPPSLAAPLGYGPTQRPADVADGSFADMSAPNCDVRFSNRPLGVKRFQALHLLRCRCRSRARASLRNRHQGPSIMGSEDEVEQSLPRPCRQTNGRSKRTCELTSSIVPRGTSFHHWVELEYSPIAFDLALSSCCRCKLFSGPPEVGAV